MARTYEETIYDATVDAVNDALAQPKLPTPDEIKGNILDNSRNAVTMYNSIAQQGAKWKVPMELETYQIAYVMLHVHYIALIETTESEDDADCSLLGVYMEDGEDEGIYTTKDSEIRRIARLYKRRITYKEFQEMMYIMREEAPRVKRCSERNLIAVNNGIFDFDTKKLMPFTPDKVFTSKSRVDYNPNAKNVVIHNDEDGTDWDVESWMDTLSDDKGVVTILWQVLGATIRPNVSWNQACFMYIDKIVDAYAKRENVDKFAHKADMSEIIENGYNLNIPRYVDTFEEEEPVDLDAVKAQIKTMDSETKAAIDKAESFMRQLGL